MTATPTAAGVFNHPMPSRIEVHGPNVKFTPETIESTYVYANSRCTSKPDGTVVVEPTEQRLQFRTVRTPAKTGLMMVGWGGNNGSTLTAGILANKHNVAWRTRNGVQTANYFGSITQASTLRIGTTAELQEVNVPLSSVVPMVHPNDLVIGGWDISKMNLGEAMRRAKVLDVTLQDAVYDAMTPLVPLPAIFDLDFVAENQNDRADNVIAGTKAEAVATIRKNIRDFKAANGLETVIIVWTANTERWCVVTPNVHDTADNMLAALERNEAELSPSTCYAIAAVQEGCAFINGAPQNTLVPGLVELAKRHKCFIGGDDFKSGQTKMKSALIEFFVAAGIKPECIASYNHLGNNDGKNLAAPKQFRSKEITKSNVVDDMVASNGILFPAGAPKPDHCIVIKYLPYVGDSKRAMDEYTFQIFLGGEQTVVMHNTCQDSLLATPLIIDLVVLTELMQRVGVREEPTAAGAGAADAPYESMDSVLSILSYMLKAPFVPAGTPVINALNRQKQAIENLLRALVGLPPENNLMMECRVPSLRPAAAAAAAAASA